MPNISRQHQLNLRLLESEKVAIRQAAHAVGLAPSVWVRHLAVKAAAAHKRRRRLQFGDEPDLPNKEPT